MLCPYGKQKQISWFLNTHCHYFILCLQKVSVNISELILANIQNQFIPGTCKAYDYFTFMSSVMSQTRDMTRDAQKYYTACQDLWAILCAEIKWNLWISEVLYKTTPSNFQVCATGLWVAQSWEDLPSLSPCGLLPKESSTVFWLWQNRNKWDFNLAVIRWSRGQWLFGRFFHTVSKDLGV